MIFRKPDGSTLSQLHLCQSTYAYTFPSKEFVVPRISVSFTKNVLLCCKVLEITSDARRVKKIIGAVHCSTATIIF